MFECQRCGIIMNRKNNFLRHLQRKFVCKPIKQDIPVSILLDNFTKKTKSTSNKKFKCEFCNKSFTRKNNLKQHKKKYCKMTNISNKNNNLIQYSFNEKSIAKIDNKNENMNYWKMLFEKSELQKQKMIEQEKQEKMELIKLFRKEKQDFMNQIELLLTKVGNNNVTNIQQNNIIIRNFGEEDTSYLTKNYFKTLFSQNKPINTIPTIVKNIYFNKEHPENMNLKITNTELPYINVYKEDKWQQQDKKDTIHKIVNKNFNLIDTKFTEVQENLPVQKKELYKEYKHQILDKNTKQSKKYIIIYMKLVLHTQ